MNPNSIRILFLKDLFLSRRFLFGYLLGGLVASAITCVPNSNVSYVGFILMITVAIAAGIHFIGILMLGEVTDQTRMFVMSMPVSVLDYSIGKFAVVLTTFLIPWSAMFACSTMGTFILPWAKHGSVVVLPAIFLFLLSAFTVQMITAIVSESIGWTICVMVGCNVALNVFLMHLFSIPSVSLATKSDAVSWPAPLLQILVIEMVSIVTALGLAYLLQTRKRDLVA